MCLSNFFLKSFQRHLIFWWRMCLHHYVIPCTYLFIKEMLTLHLFGKQFKAIAAIIAVGLSLLMITLMLIILAACVLITSIMRLVLLLWLREKYGGVLGMDSYFVCTKSCITSVYIIEHSGTFEELYTIIKQSCSRLYRSHYKFSTTVRDFCGFYFLVKNEVSLDDIIFVEHWMDILKRESLITYLEEHCFNDWDDNKLWKVILFNKPIQWTNDSKAYYPIIIRYNHCIGDGIALSAFAQTFLLNDVKNERFENIMRKSSKSRDVLKTSHLGKVLLVGPTLETLKLYSATPDQNLAVFIEETPKYVDLIRYLSKRLKCSFTDIITTAAVASLTEYLNLESAKSKNLIVYNTARPLGDKFELVLQGKMLTNAFTLDAFNLPWMKGNNILARFNEIKTILKAGKKSANGQIIYLLSNVLSYLHPVLITKFSRYNSIGTTLGITNIPFADYAKMGICPVKDTFSFVNHFEETKFVLILCSYGGRLQATLSSKQHLKTSRAELQEILNNIFVNIDHLYEEVKLV